MSTGMMGERLWSDFAASANVALFRFAKVVAANKLDLCGAGGISVGIFTDVAGNAKPATVQLDGVGKITLASTLDPGVKVQSDSDGKAVAFSSGHFCGTLLTGGSSGDVVSIKIAI